MASGKTVDMILFSKQVKWRVTEDRPARERDRSLAGKARRRARQAKS